MAGSAVRSVPLKPLATIVEEYIYAAIAMAEVTELESGALVATVPGCTGIVASGVDTHECAEDLFRRLEDWVLVNLARGNRLPPIRGIDLNTEANRTLATYHASRIASAKQAGTYFANEEELDREFERRDQYP